MTVMPISPIVLQRRHAELGRIRLGRKVATSNGKTRPEKLDRFRFTSANERLISDIAKLYGGEPKPWDNSGKAEFEVYTDARSIPVIVVRGGFSQWMESWSGGGCVHRCDGERGVDGALCDADDPKHREAKATTRLSVMLRDVETLGVFRLESHGWNAAAELPMLVEIAQHVGDLVPAWLNLEERRAIKDGKTSRFVVPVLDLEVSKARLVELVGGASNGAPQIGSGSAATQIAAAPERPDYTADIAACTTIDEVSSLWRQIAASGHLFDDVKAALTARAKDLQAGEQPNPDDATHDAEVEDDSGAAWMAVVAEAGQHGWTSDILTAAFESWAAIPVSDGVAEQFREFLAALRRGEIQTEVSG